MSIEALRWARKMGRVANLPTPQLLLLWILADHADEYTFEAWPHQRTLARDTGMSERSVRRHLNGLEEAGIITRQVRYGDVKNYRTGEKISNVRLSDLYTLQKGMLGVLAQARRASEDPDVEAAERALESARGVVVEPLEDYCEDEESLAEDLPANLSGRGLTPVEKSPANLSGREKSRVNSEPANLSGRGSTGQIVQTLPDNGGHGGPDSHSSPRARIKNPHQEPSSSSSDVGEYRSDDDDDKRPSMGFRGVDLGEVQQTVASLIQRRLTDLQARNLIDVILDRASQRVMNPPKFVAASLKRDPHALAEELDRLFGPMTRDQRVVPKLCPIPEHTREGHRAKNCPACRKWRDFPAEIDRDVFEELDTDVQAYIADRGEVRIVSGWDASAS